MTPEHEQMVFENMGLVKMVASRMARNNYDSAIDFDDLVQSGTMGLMHAAERFDPGQNLKFSTYATNCINGYVLRAMNKTSSIGVSVNTKHLAGIIKRRNLDDKTVEEIAEMLKVTEDRVRRSLKYLECSVVSHDREISEAFHRNEKAYGDYFRSTPDDYSSLTLQEFLPYLNDRQKELLFYMLRDMSLREIAPFMGVSFQRLGVLKKEIKARYEFYLRKSGGH